MSTNTELERIINTSTCLITESEIDKRISKLAYELSDKLNGEDPVFLCTLVGALIFTGKLTSRIKIPIQIDYAHASRYGESSSGNEVTWHATPKISLKNRTVVILDDVLDGGITMRAIYKYCLENDAKKVLSVVMIDKPSGRSPGGLQKPDFTCFTIGDYWLVGTGLDYKGYLRNLPGIYAMDPEVVKEYY